MKKTLAVLLALVMLVSFAACGTKPAAGTSAQTSEAEVPTPENPIIRLSTTTSVNDSGLLPYLLPVFEQETGYKNNGAVAFR